ncbi:hypothetical protein J2X01_001724 [Arthrobacter ginsengisoli]|uniref:Uncharacterized protein n=1 Tax=Arthrobacter ginsengisoli TaxID=1356565 RepID=A0ABU1UBF1_9MICC|nr:hypothetical protein [Arthrobacter ginsengisoli]MDR7082435.1 hypothetical protein [Arthrobacter ginsengisoli]
MAIQRTMGGRALRYCAVVILLAATQLAGFWFHSAGVYQGPANVPLSEFPEDVALMIDMASIFSSSKPRADSGFAMLAAVFQTPLVLIASGGAIAAIVFWKHLPPRAGATEAH